MNAPVAWQPRVEAYLAHRRSLGFNLTHEGTRLSAFARFADAMGGQDRLTVALAVQWARASQRQSPLTWARRIEVLRGFARFCLRYEPDTEIRSRDLFGPAHRRLVPHIYTDEELVALLDAADHLLPPNGLRPTTCRTVFGLLAASGLRISEALGLKRTDVDLEDGVLWIRETKFYKCRLVPLHQSAVESRRAYAQLRDQKVAHPRSDRFFLHDEGVRPINRVSCTPCRLCAGNSVGSPVAIMRIIACTTCAHLYRTQHPAVLSAGHRR